MAVTAPTQLVKFVGTESNALFDFVEASVQPAKQCLPFLKAQERRELTTTLRVALAVRPKRGKNLLFACFGVAEHQEEGVIILVVCQPRSQPNCSCDRKTALLAVRVVCEGVVNTVLKVLPAFLAHADCSSLGKGNSGLVNRNPFRCMIFWTAYPRGHRLSPFEVNN